MSMKDPIQIHLTARSLAIYLWHYHPGMSVQACRILSVPAAEGIEQVWESLRAFDGGIHALDAAKELGHAIEVEYRNAGSTILCPGDAGYPNPLFAMRTAPILSVRGSTEALHAPQIAIVGSRRTAPDALRITTLIADYAMDRGMTVTSGGALGIDAMAHRRAMERGLPTIVVSATGTAKFYPAENRDIFAYASQHGAVVSQFPNCKMEHSPNFPQRNDVIAALSVATVIVHCREKSGALYTAQAARRMNRPVFVAALTGFDELTMGGLARVAKSEAELLYDLPQLDRVIPGGDPPPRQLALALVPEIAPVGTEAQILHLLRKGKRVREQLRAELGEPADFDGVVLELELSGKIEYGVDGYALVV